MIHLARIVITYILDIGMELNQASLVNMAIAFLIFVLFVFAIKMNYNLKAIGTKLKGNPFLKQALLKAPDPIENFICSSYEKVDSTSDFKIK